MMQNIFQIQENFDSLIKIIPVIDVSWKSINMEWDIYQNVQFWS